MPKVIATQHYELEPLSVGADWTDDEGGYGALHVNLGFPFLPAAEVFAIADKVHAFLKESGILAQSR